MLPVLAIWGYLSHQRTGIWKDSYTLMSDMISMYPDHVPFAYNNRGLWLDKNSRNPEALENFKNAIRLDPRSPNAYLNAGRAFGQMQMPDSAIVYLEKVLTMDGGDSKVYNNLGNAYGLKGNFLKAQTAFTKAIELDPSNANAYYNLAVTYSMTGDTVQTDYWMRESARRGNAGAQNALQSRGKTW
jgi:tetratricopeptide (TPR) repeat protein